VTGKRFGGPSDICPSTNALLKRHEVTEQALTHEDVDADVESVNELLAPPCEVVPILVEK
jgi:hypothetical protein